MSSAQNVSDADFEAEVLKSSKPVLVDFWAEWCGPCRAMAPILDEVAAQEPRIKVVKVNVDENPRTATTYRINSIPTMIVFSAGEPVKNLMGGRPKERLLRELADILK